MTGEQNNIAKALKDNIIALVNQNRLTEAKMLLERYSEMMPSDIEICSIRGVIAIQEGDPAAARESFEQGLVRNKEDFDLQFNLAYLEEAQNRLCDAANIYERLRREPYSEEQRQRAEAEYRRIIDAAKAMGYKPTCKVAFFVKNGLDSFIKDIAFRLGSCYEVKKIVVTDLRQIDDNAEWADVCWFEWCDELLIHASAQSWAQRKKMICRLHSYEAFTSYINQVNWSVVDRVVFVAEHIREYVLREAGGLSPRQTLVVPNGIDMERYSFKERQHGFNIAYVGYINYKKGPMLLLHAMKAIVDADSRYKLYIAGKFQDPRYSLYFEQMIRVFGLQENVIFQGWQEDISQWLEDKNYIISTSVLEGNPLGIMEAMARGIMPLIHNFVGCEQQFGPYVWNSIEDCVKMITTTPYDSHQYRKWIDDKYSLAEQLQTLQRLITDLFNGNEEQMAEYYRQKFESESDNIPNTERLFDYLLDQDDEVGYMDCLQQWFVKSKLPLQSQVQYFYGNLYRRMRRYSRFDHMQEAPYEKLVQTGEKYLEKLYSRYFEAEGKKYSIAKREKTRILFVLNGLDYKQIVTRFYVDLIMASKNPNVEYYIVSLLPATEFQNVDFSIDVLNRAGIAYYVPGSSNYDGRMEEFYKIIEVIKPDVAFFQSLYFAPIAALLYPLLKKICRYTARFVHQQAEPYFDRQLDFLGWYIPGDKSVVAKEFFDFPWPIKSDLIEKNRDVRARFGIDRDEKVIVSMARDTYFRDNQHFWEFIIRVVTEIPGVSYVVFGPQLDEHYAAMIPTQLLEQKKIVLAGFDLEAAAYLRSCDAFLNTFPMGGGSSLQEAYFAELPLVSYVAADSSEVDLEQNSYLIPKVWYDDAMSVLPQVGDENGLFALLRDTVTNEDFRKQLRNRRKIAVKDMTYQAFAAKLEKYLQRKLKR